MSTAPSSLQRGFEAVAGEKPADSGALFGVDVDPVQLDLLRGADGRLPSNVFRVAREQAAQVKRGPGRPAGSPNKRSTDLAKLLQSKYPDPVQFMAGLYATPLDQLCEALLIADGTIERQNRLDELLEPLAAQVKLLVKMGGDNKAIERLAEACEALEDVARQRGGKPGEVAIKALNVQLAAAKSVAEYVHSKKPTEVAVKHAHDAILVMPATGGGQSFDAVDAGTREASNIIAGALAGGRITPDMLVGLEFRDGQLVDAEWTDVPEDAERAE